MATGFFRMLKLKIIIITVVFRKHNFYLFKYISFSYSLSLDTFSLSLFLVFLVLNCNLLSHCCILCFESFGPRRNGIYTQKTPCIGKYVPGQQLLERAPLESLLFFFFFSLFKRRSPRSKLNRNR